MQPRGSNDVDDLIAHAVDHFRAHAKDEPTEEEVAALRRAALRGKDLQGLRYVTAGLLGVRRQKALYGENAMKLARSKRGQTNKPVHTPQDAGPSLENVRRAWHAAVDAWFDFEAGRAAR